MIDPIASKQLAMVLYYLGMYSTAPVHRMLLDRMITPLIGDYVFETSTFYCKTRPAADGIGRLVGRQFPFGYDQMVATFDYKRWNYVIRTARGEDSWNNCEFVVVMGFDQWRRFENSDRQNALDERTWWWRDRAKREEEKVKAHALAWSKTSEAVEAYNKWRQNVGE